MITPLTPCQHLYPFQRYSQSNSIVTFVLNHTEFWTFLPSQILKGGAPPQKNVVPAVLPSPRGTSRGKASWGYPSCSRSYRRAFMNFKPIIDPPLYKIVKGPQFPVECALAYFLACVKISGRSTL